MQAVGVLCDDPSHLRHSLPDFSPRPSTHHGWPSREQALASRFNTARKVPRRGAGSFSAHEHDLGERISRPGAASIPAVSAISLGRLMRFAT